MCDAYTIFEYLYRDAGNYKAWGRVLLTGMVTLEQEAEFRKLLDGGEFFVAEKVGIPPLNRTLWTWSGGQTEDDHGFHEFQGFRPAMANDMQEPVWAPVERLFDKFRTDQISPIFTSL